MVRVTITHLGNMKQPLDFSCERKDAEKISIEIERKKLDKKAREGPIGGSSLPTWTPQCSQCFYHLRQVAFTDV